MDPELQAFLDSLMGRQAVPMSTASDMPSYGPQAVQAAPGGPTYAPAVQAPAQDPREALMAALFAPPPTQQTDPTWKTMGKGGKVGLILSALGDVANVLQRQSAKGARTFAPSNYTGQYIAGERQKLQEKHRLADRADQIKRAGLAHQLDRLDRADTERKRIARVAEIKAMDEAKNLRELQEAANMPGATRAEILIRRNELETENRQSKAAHESKMEGLAQATSERADAAAGRAQATADRAASGVDKVENRRISDEQRKATRMVRGAVMGSSIELSDKMDAAAAGGTPMTAEQAAKEYTRLKRLVQVNAEANGLSDAGQAEVDTLFEQEVGDVLRKHAFNASQPPPAPPGWTFGDWNNPPAPSPFHR
jgi:hypothetical protein